MGFWDALDSAPRSPAALPSGPAGASSFWGTNSRSTTQAIPTTVESSESMSEADTDSPSLLSPSYWGGMLINAVKDVPEMLQGLWTIGKASVEDAIAAGQKANVLPGSSLENRVEEQGYNWGNIVDAFPELIRSDYAARYGAWGLDEVKDQVYSNPLSYVFDALTVSAGVGAGAKVASLGAKAGSPLARAATAIRGVDPMTSRLGTGIASAARAAPDSNVARSAVAYAGRPVTPVTGLTGSAGSTPVGVFGSSALQVSQGTMGITTSVSPLKRLIQNTIINKVMSRSTDATKRMIEQGQWNRLGISPENPGLREQAIARVTEAVEQGQRVMRPFPEKFIASRAARYIAGVSKSEFYGARNLMMQRLRNVLGPETKNGADWELAKDIMGTNDTLRNLLDGGMIDPNGVPSNAPINVHAGSTIPILDDVTTPLVTVDPDQRLSAFEAVERYFNPVTGVTKTSFHTPHSRVFDGETKAARFTGLVGDIKDAPRAAMDLAEKNNWRLIGVRDYLQIPNDQSSWNGLHYFFDTGNGIVEVNIADNQLYNVQRLASDISKRMDDLSGVQAGFEGEMAALSGLREMLGPDFDRNALSVADKANLERLETLERLLPNVQEELDAMALWKTRLWDRPLRGYNGNYEGFGDNVRKVDELFGWSTEFHTLGMAKYWHPEWINKGYKGPFTVAVNRAFMPMKLEVLHSLMKNAEKDIENILNTVKNRDEAVLNVWEYLADRHRLPADVIRDALFTMQDKHVASAIYQAAKQGMPVRSQEVLTRLREVAEHVDAPADEAYEAMRLPIDNKLATKEIIRRINDNVRTPILRGEVDGTDLEDWSWRNFADSVPQLPGYYPHIRMGSPGGLWWKGATMTAPKMQFNKGFKGYLMENGAVLDDPFKAYSFRAYQILRHQELIDQFEALRQHARELSTAEMEMLKSGALKLEGEKLFSPDYVKNRLSLHARLLDDVTDNFDDGMLYEDAAKKALEGLNEQLQTGVLNDLDTAKVYALPNYVAKQFESGFIKGFSPATMKVFWDGPRDLWISSVLGLNPRWFIYRTMGNIMFAGIAHPTAIPRMFGWTRPKNNSLIAAIMDDTETANGTLLSEVSRGYAAAEMQRTGFLPGSKKKMGAIPGAGTRVRQWGSAADEWPRLTAMADRAYNSKLSALPKRISQGMTQMVNVMEQAERRGIAVSVLARQTGMRFERSLNVMRRVAREGVDQANVSQMMDEANWVLGNYTTLSPIERDVVRRFLMPFYPFYRHMLKFATRMPWDHPLKSNVLRLLHEVDEDMGPHLPPFLGGGVFLGQIGGMPSYWNITRWNPLSELALPESNPLMFLDPRLRTLISAWTGTDEFMAPYEAANVYHAPNGVRLIRTASGWEPFEGIEHPPWMEMIASFYGGPGSSFINPRGYNMPWWKAAAGQAGFTISQYDATAQRIRDLEAAQAAFSSSTAREVPVTYGA